MIREVHDLKNKERADHELKFGSFNSFPPNWKPIQEDDFWSTFMTYSPILQEYRQMYPVRKDDPSRRDHNARMTVAKLFYFGRDEGLAMVEVVVNARKVRPQFFQFAACEHEWRHTGTPYNCYNTYECTKCKMPMAIDSSD